MKNEQIRHSQNPRLWVQAYSGHFATRHSHNTHYIDITDLKHSHVNAREVAMSLAYAYTYEKGVDTIVCLDGSEVIGAFLARHLTKNDRMAVNADKNIYVVTPEYDANGLLIFRDNLTHMIQGKNVLILVSAIHSGKTARQAVECVQYYGGTIQGIASVFSVHKEVEGIPVYSLFSPEDVPGYGTYAVKECPLCAAGQKIEALSNSYGLSLL